MDSATSSATISPVRVVALRKVYGRHAALAGVDGELAAGQVSVLMGPNGAGKSTLLGLLSTLARPTSGEVFFGPWSHREAERDLRHTIGFLGHAPLLYRDLSARENLTFFGRLYGLTGLSARVEQWLAQTGMSAAAERPVRQLSRGMTQRVALGRALLHEPQLLLLDEPFTALDRGGVALLRQVIRSLRQAGRTVVLATHDVEAVSGLCDQLWVLRRGRIVARRSGATLDGAALLAGYHQAIDEPVDGAAPAAPSEAAPGATDDIGRGAP
ncbi:MAG: heme ABC exporter ATP-binding protein CcmA [Proteobacteria bacterium]|nr:heme ABC exporter ATP-binding protein CcmA [Pseudomonadota bacterium]